MFSRQATQNARFAARCARRPARTANPQFRTQQPRFQSTVSEATSGNSGAGSHAAIGAVSGAAAAITVGYIFYRQSGARDVVLASKKTKDYVNSATQKIKEQTPEPNEALEWLRNAAQSYAAFIPGAKGYVDSAFNDLVPSVLSTVTRLTRSFAKPTASCVMFSATAISASSPHRRPGAYWSSTSAASAISPATLLSRSWTTTPS